MLGQSSVGGEWKKEVFNSSNIVPDGELLQVRYGSGASRIT